jgi:hypothetical protein
MKKYILIGAVVIAAIIAAGIFGYAYAQDPKPAPSWGPRGMGRMNSGMGHGRGEMMAHNQAGQGILHPYMVAGMAEALDLSSEALEARLQAGETMWQIAEAQSWDIEQFRTTMLQVRQEAIVQAVAAGVFTQEQADWMSQHGQGMHGSGLGNGECRMENGTEGAGSPRGRWGRQP